jgi:hypothetical protein
MASNSGRGWAGGELWYHNVVMLDDAGRILNRALQLWGGAVGDEPVRAGDRHLSALKHVCGLEYNGGIGHVLGCCTPAEIEAAGHAAGYFGLGELAQVLDQLSRLSAFMKAAEDAETPEEHERIESAMAEWIELGDLQPAYDNALPSYFLIDEVFRRKLRDTPYDFAPLD